MSVPRELHPWNEGFVWEDHTGPFTTITTGQAEQFDRSVRARDVELAELLGGAARDVASFVQQRRQELIVEAPPDLGTIHVEPVDEQESWEPEYLRRLGEEPDPPAPVAPPAPGSGSGTA